MNTATKKTIVTTMNKFFNGIKKLNGKRKQFDSALYDYCRDYLYSKEDPNYFNLNDYDDKLSLANLKKFTKLLKSCSLNVAGMGCSRITFLYGNYAIKYCLNKRDNYVELESFQRVKKTVLGKIICPVVHSFVWDGTQILVFPKVTIFGDEHYTEKIHKDKIMRKLYRFIDHHIMADLHEDNIGFTTKKKFLITDYGFGIDMLTPVKIKKLNALLMEARI